MQHGPKHPDWMQWIPCSVIECRRFNAFWRNGSRLYAVESMQRGKMHLIECSGFYAAWPKAARWNAVDSMHCDWMQCNPCSVVKCIPIECSGFHAAPLNAEDSLHFGAMDPDCMQWSPFSEAQCIPLNAVDFMQHGPKHPDWVSGFHAVWCNWFSLNALIPCIKAQWFLIECTGFHAAF